MKWRPVSSGRALGLAGRSRDAPLVGFHPGHDVNHLIDGDLSAIPQPGDELPVIDAAQAERALGNGRPMSAAPIQVPLDVGEEFLEHGRNDDGLLPICLAHSRPFHRQRRFAAKSGAMTPDDEQILHTVRRRTEQRIAELGTNMKAVSLSAGLGETFVRDMLRRGRDPSVEAVAKIAQAMHTTTSWLCGVDDDQLAVPAVTQNELVTVPEYDVRLSAGGGALVERENQSGVWQFSRRYLVDELRLSPANLAIVEVQGDSMYPTLLPGDRVLIDHSDRNPALPGIYAIWDSHATVVKRVERVPASNPPKLVLISDNKSHNQYTVPADQVNVIGRVVWFARRL